MPDKHWPLQVQAHPWFPQAHAAERLINADMVEVRVTLTPMQWFEREQQHQRGESLQGQSLIARIEARDHRAVFHITRQMLEEMFRHYMGLDINPK